MSNSTVCHVFIGIHKWQENLYFTKENWRVQLKKYNTKQKKIIQLEWNGSNTGYLSNHNIYL